jgi:hypothetical protein
VPRRQRRQARGPGRGSWPRLQPGDKPIDVHRGRSGHGLYVGFFPAPIAGAPPAKGADPLGQGAFDARAAFIALCAFVTALPGAGRLEHLVLGLGGAAGDDGPAAAIGDSTGARGRDDSAAGGRKR